MSIFPPSGDQDAERCALLSQDERAYMWFSLEFCDKILSLRPNHIEALELAANHCTALGYYADGLAIDYRLAMLNPNDPGVIYNLSCSLALTGKREEALSELAKAVASGYVDFRHMSTDRDLASIHDDPRFKVIVAMAEKKT